MTAGDLTFQLTNWGTIHFETTLGSRYGGEGKEEPPLRGPLPLFLGRALFLEQKPHNPEQT